MSYKTVTMSFLGTGQHRETHANIITSFHQAIVRENDANLEFAERLFDGIGAAPKQSNSPNPMLGTYLFDPIQKKKIPIKPFISEAVSTAIKKLSGVVVGEGMEDLLFEAVLYLNQLIKENEGELPETINLQGFSRGADACLRLANVIYQLYPAIKINLFLIDHVPGPGRGNDPHSYTVPANVRSFKSRLMLHEYRLGFEPQHAGTYVFSAPDKTKAEIGIYYGRHSGSNVIFERPEKNHAPLLLYDDLYKFCLETGSLSAQGNRPNYIAKQGNQKKEINSLNQLTKEKRFELLCGMKVNESIYAKGTKFHRRKILFKGDDYVQNSILFINQEHRELFKQLYPKTFHWFFEKNHGMKASEEEVLCELNTLKDDPRYSDFVVLLGTLFSFDVAKIAKETLPRPSGVDQDEKNKINQPLITDRLSYLRHTLLSIANYYHYHSNRKNLIDDILENIINKSVKFSYKLEEDKAINYLEKLIEKMKDSPSVNKSFFRRKLHHISPNVVDYTSEVVKLLSAHSIQNSFLSRAQRKAIKETIKLVKEINRDDSQNSHQKYHQIRREIIALNGRLGELKLVMSDNLLFDNMIHHAAHALQKNKENIFNLPSLTKSLNALSYARFGATDLCDPIIENLKSYQKRNSFWDTIQSILNRCGIPFSHSYSTDKKGVADSLLETLEELKKEGKGCDIVAMKKSINIAQSKLFALYKKNEKMEKGVLDKIIDRAMVFLNEKSLTDTASVSEPSIAPEAPEFLL